MPVSQSDIAKIVLTYDRSSRTPTGIALLGSDDGVLYSASDRTNEWGFDTAAADVTTAYAAYAAGTAVLEYYAGGSGYYAETSNLYDSRIAADSTLTIRRPHQWMVDLNWFLKEYLDSITPQNAGTPSTPASTGVHASLTLWGYFSSLANARTAAAGIARTWDGERLSLSQAASAWQWDRDSLPAAGTGQRLYSAHSNASYLNGSWTLDAWYVLPSASAFDIQWTTERRPTDATAGTYPEPENARFYRRRSEAGAWEPWIRLSSLPVHEWVELVNDRRIWDIPENLTDFANFDLSHYEEILFGWTFYNGETERGYAEARIRADDIKTVWESEKTQFTAGRTLRLWFSQSGGGRVARSHEAVSEGGTAGNEQIFYVNLKAETDRNSIVDQMYFYTMAFERRTGRLRVFGR